MIEYNPQKPYGAEIVPHPQPTYRAGDIERQGEREFTNLTPTSHPDLFVTREGHLVHRMVGPISQDAAHVISLPDKSPLRIFHGAPEVAAQIEPLGARLAELRNVASGDTAAVVSKVTEFVGKASGYLAVAEFAIQVVNLLVEAVFGTEDKLGAIDQKLQTLLVQTAANDYLALSRRMADMRGNAKMITHTLASLDTLLGQPAHTWYSNELQDADRQLKADIYALLEPGSGYFRRTYVEHLIAGDGHWMHFIPDRPVDSNGTTYEYRLALPTVTLLMAVRLAMMKFTVPDFLSRGTFTVELNYYYDQLSDVAESMYFYVRKVPPTPVEIQAVRRQQAGDKLGNYFDWQQHRAVGPPGSISPNGAIDITTGFGEINWEYVQFDEWYLSKGDLRGGNAGYWPPSIGPNFYRPPPQATGLPPLERAIHDYYGMHRNDAIPYVRRVQDQIGATATDLLSWDFLRLAFPGAPI